MPNYYITIIYIVPLISVDGQASPSLFIAPEIRHEKISYPDPDPLSRKINHRNIINAKQSLIKLHRS